MGRPPKVGCRGRARARAEAGYPRRGQTQGVSSCASSGWPWRWWVWVWVWAWPSWAAARRTPARRRRTVTRWGTRWATRWGTKWVATRWAATRWAATRWKRNDSSRDRPVWVEGAATRWNRNDRGSGAPAAARQPGPGGRSRELPGAETPPTHPLDALDQRPGAGRHDRERPDDLLGQRRLRREPRRRHPLPLLPRLVLPGARPRPQAGHR